MECEHRDEYAVKVDLILDPQSPAFKALQKIILDKRFLNQAKYYVRFRYSNQILLFIKKKIET